MALDLSSAYRALLVDFSYPGPNNTQVDIALTNFTEPLTVDGRVYSVEPAMQLLSPEFDASLNDKPTRLRLRNIYSFLRNAASGRAFPLIRVVIKSLTFSPENPGTLSETSVLYYWSGEVSQVTINPEGTEGLVEIESQFCGGSVDRELGIICSPQCWKKFGTTACGADLGLLKEAGIVQSISESGRVLTITGLSQPSASYWQGGSVDLFGADVRIRNWNITDPTTFELSKYAPVDFTNAVLPAAISVTPGCNRTLGDCRIFNNENSFGGLGIGLPDRNPQIDRGQS